MKYISRWVRPLLILCLAALTGAAVAEEGSTSGPQTLVELTYDFGKDVAFESYSVDLTLHHPIEGNVNLLIAPAGLVIDGKPLSAGLQTLGGGYHFKHQRDRADDVGKAIELRMTGTNDIALVRVEDAQMFDRGTEANPFVSVNIPVAWQKGHYTVFVRKQGQRTIDNKTYTWLEASLYEHLSGREAYTGGIRFEGTEFTMAGTMSACIQLTGDGTIPTAKITTGGWQINGEPTLPLSAKVHYPNDAPPRVTCKTSGQSIAIVLGLDAKHSKNRKLTKTPDGYEQTLFERKASPES